MNEMLGRKPKLSKSISLQVDNEIVTDDLKVSNVFNDFFCQIGEDLAHTINSDRDIWKFNTLPMQSSSIYLRPGTLQEVIILIKNLNVNKSPGSDNIPASIIKFHHAAFAEILTEVFNEMVVTGVYPDSLKTARVIPIFKSDDPSSTINYRPISTLSVLNKILEQMLCSRITDFCVEHKLFYKRQYGFRRGCSTLTATSELVDEIYRDLDSKRFSGVLFLDLKKAFDTINHDLLLSKLEIYGIRGKAHDLLKSYLSNRKQFVSVNGKISDKKIISTGVPQGSNLGPLLFLIFINDISSLKLNGRIQLFADDTALLYSGLNANCIVHNIKQDMQRLHEFFNSNLLSLNLRKTTYVIFHSLRRSIPELPIVELNNVEIRRVNEFKYLGLTIDSTLNWESHIEQLKNKITPICGILRKISSIIPKVWMMKLYFSMVHSRLQYLVSLWGIASKSRLRELQTLQNRCLKVIHGKPHLYATHLLFNNVNDSVLPIVGLQASQTITQMHNIMTNPDIHYNLKFHRVSTERSTRQAGSIRLTRPNTELGKRRFSYNGSKLYNDLPISIKQSHSYSSFKHQLRLHLKLHIHRYLP